MKYNWHAQLGIACQRRLHVYFQIWKQNWFVIMSKTNKIKSFVISSPRSSSSQNFSQPRTSSRNTRKHCYSSNLPRDRVSHTSGDMEEIVWLVTTGEGEVQQQRPPNFPSPKRRLRVLYLFSRKSSGESWKENTLSCRVSSSVYI